MSLLSELPETIHELEQCIAELSNNGPRTEAWRLEMLNLAIALEQVKALTAIGSELDDIAGSLAAIATG